MISSYFSAAGFTAAGIAAGSTAAGMMGAAATASGGAVAAGSTVSLHYYPFLIILQVAVLQSVGAAGLGAAIW